MKAFYEIFLLKKRESCFVNVVFIDKSRIFSIGYAYAFLSLTVCE